MDHGICCILQDITHLAKYFILFDEIISKIINPTQRVKHQHIKRKNIKK